MNRRRFSAESWTSPRQCIEKSRRREQAKLREL